jgi:hypothetical protein
MLSGRGMMLNEGVWWTNDRLPTVAMVIVNGRGSREACIA